MTEKLMNGKAVLELTAMSQGTLYTLMSEGRFPRPLKVGKRAVRWVESEVVEWLDERKQARDQEREEATAIG